MECGASFPQIYNRLAAIGVLETPLRGTSLAGLWDARCSVEASAPLRGDCLCHFSELLLPDVSGVFGAQTAFEGFHPPFCRSLDEPAIEC